MAFLNPELSLIILQGEVKGNLGKELLIYGRREWEGLMKLADKKIRFLQPMMFLLIAVLIISVYSALLLPIYKGMGICIDKKQPEKEEISRIYFTRNAHCTFCNCSVNFIICP